jgi:hypothetical protein
MLKSLSILGYVGMAGGIIEEILVTARYPDYRQYAETTWRMIPYIF